MKSKSESVSFLVSCESSIETEVRADMICAHTLEPFLVASGLLDNSNHRPSRADLSLSLPEEAKYMFLTELLRLKKCFEVSFVVGFKGELFRFLALEKMLYAFLIACKEATGDNSEPFLKQKQHDGNGIFYAVKVSKTKRSYEDIVSFMDEIPSSIFYLEDGSRHSLGDTVTKIIFEELDETDPLYVYIGDDIAALQRLTTLTNIVELLQDHKENLEVYYKNSTGVEWNKYTDVFEDSLDQGKKTNFDFKSFLEFLDVISSSDAFAETRFKNPFIGMKLPLSGGKSQDLLLRTIADVYKFLQELALHKNFKTILKQEAGQEFFSLIGTLVRLGFSQYSLSSFVTCLKREERALLSFVKHMRGTPFDSFLMFRSFLSGLSASKQERLINEIEISKRSSLFFDDQEAISQKLLSLLNTKIISLESKEYFYNESSPIKGDFVSAKNTNRHRNLCLLPETVQLEDVDARGKFIEKLRLKNRFSSVAYFDFSSDIRKKNDLITFGSFTGILPILREVYARHPLSLVRGLTAEHFSYFSNKGKCKSCSGRGYLNDERTGRFDCYSCKGGRLTSEIETITVDTYSFSDIFLAPIEDLGTFFENRSLLKDVYSSCMSLSLGKLSLSSFLFDLYETEYKKSFLLKILPRLRKSSQCIMLDGFFRGVSRKEAEKIIPFIAVNCDKGARVLVQDTAFFTTKLIDEVFELR